MSDSQAAGVNGKSGASLASGRHDHASNHQLDRRRTSDRVATATAELNAGVKSQPQQQPKDRHASNGMAGDIGRSVEGDRPRSRHRRSNGDGAKQSSSSAADGAANLDTPPAPTGSNTVRRPKRKSSSSGDDGARLKRLASQDAPVTSNSAKSPPPTGLTTVETENGRACGKTQDNRSPDTSGPDCNGGDRANLSRKQRAIPAPLSSLPRRSSSGSFTASPAPEKVAVAPAMSFAKRGGVHAKREELKEIHSARRQAIGVLEQSLEDLTNEEMVSLLSRAHLVQSRTRILLDEIDSLKKEVQDLEGASTTGSGMDVPSEASTRLDERDADEALAMILSAVTGRSVQRFEASAIAEQADVGKKSDVDPQTLLRRTRDVVEAVVMPHVSEGEVEAEEDVR